MISRIALVLQASLLLAAAQRADDDRPRPLTPAEAAQQGRARAAELLAQKPAENAVSTGWLTRSQRQRKQPAIPVRFETLITSTNWLTIYETFAATNGPSLVRLAVIHTPDRANEYLLTSPADTGSTNSGPRHLAGAEAMTPFAGSDFWVADLGLEFLHWPGQRLLKKELRHSKSCDVFESLNPNPARGSYRRVVSWITLEEPRGVIVHADAYDADDKLLKEFDPQGVEKVQGQWQLEGIEMRNPKASTKTVIEFDLGK